MKKLLFLTASAAALWAWILFFGAKNYPPGVLVKNEPQQVLVTEPMERIQRGNFLLQPLAFYVIEARVLHTKHYWGGDSADLVPFDVAVGWGPMSDQSVLDHLSISQGNRFYFYEWQGQPPIVDKEIICHSANMHLIPSAFGIRETIAWLRRGELVRMRGLLVEATNLRNPRIGPWRSSLTRTDTGNGACELMWVESIEKM